MNLNKLGVGSFWSRYARSCLVLGNSIRDNEQPKAKLASVTGFLSYHLGQGFLSYAVETNFEILKFQNIPTAPGNPYKKSCVSQKFHPWESRFFTVRFQFWKSLFFAWVPRVFSPLEYERPVEILLIYVGSDLATAKYILGGIYIDVWWVKTPRKGES